MRTKETEVLLPIAPDLVVVYVGRQDTADPREAVRIRTEAIALDVSDGAGSIGAGKVGGHRQIADRCTPSPTSSRQEEPAGKNGISCASPQGFVV